MGCNDFDDIVASILSEFITARRGAGEQVVYPIDEINEREFDALLRHRTQLLAERECEHIVRLLHDEVRT
jgi:hypothetical protein